MTLTQYFNVNVCDVQFLNNWALSCSCTLCYAIAPWGDGGGGGGGGGKELVVKVEAFLGPST